MNILQTKLDTSRRRLGFSSPLTVGALLFDDHAQLDIYGPLELLTAINYKRSRSIQVQTIGLGKDELVGPTPWTIPDTRLAQAVQNNSQIDLLLIPGGAEGVAKVKSIPSQMEKIGKLVTQSTVVCTFSQGWELVQGKVTEEGGVVELEYNSEEQQIQWQKTTFRNRSTEVYSANGVSAGMELIYHVIIGQLFGPKMQTVVSNFVEYEPVIKAPGCLGDTKRTDDAPQDPTSFQLPRSDIATPQKPKQPISIAFVLYDSFEMMDTFGPMEMFLTANRLAGGDWIKITSVAEKAQVKSVAGPYFRVDATFAELDAAVDTPTFDILFVPGGIGSLREIHNDKMQSFLKAHTPQAAAVLTVCTGANVLAATGLMDGQPATSNKLAFRQLTSFRPLVNWVEKARWVTTLLPGTDLESGTRSVQLVTSSGVSAGTDAALAVLHDLYAAYGKSAWPLFADHVADAVGYVRNPISTHDPFACTIPRNTLWIKIAVAIQSALLRLLYKGGMALGYPMYSLGPKLIGL